VRFSPKIEENLREFSPKIGGNLSEIFSQNRRNFERDFLPKSEKAVTKFSKAGGGYPPPTPLGRAAPEYWGSTADVFNL
jgi:hypothetical protein